MSCSSALSGQIAPALILQAFFDMLTGDAAVTGFGIWAIAGAVVRGLRWGACWAHTALYYADVPLFCRHGHPAAQEPADAHPAPPGRRRRCPIRPARPSAASANDVNEIPLFVICDQRHPGRRW